MLASFDLSGKTALVTGCKRGIGRGMAEALAGAGADIVGVSASLELEGSDVEQSVRGMGRNFKAYQCDFSDRTALRSFVTQLESDGVAPDILVNNAGTIKRKPAAEHPDEWWDEVIEVNLSAQFILAREIGR
ncbi:MAG: SDR family NAD(P)-dependent oxidoreductase, partial [Shimia sp.]|nr:SDR family NAD(P)-dependent oxidoreductase [Shimia sp.]